MIFPCRFILRTSTKIFSLHRTRNTSNVIRFDPCTGCEIPCSKHVSYPPEILATIDQSEMINSIEKHRRHLCIGQSFLPSQWPKDVKNLSGNYLKELAEIFSKKKDAIGYSVKLTSASLPSTTDSEANADWYLFPDQLKISNVKIEQIDQVVEKLFVHDRSIIQIKDTRKTIEEQLQTYNSLPEFPAEIQCERLNGLWILVCCHQQRDQRCGVIGPILVNEIEKHVQKTNQTENIHCLKISHIGGHRFAGNVIVYPSGAWYGRVSACHIPLLIDAYISSANDLKEKLKPLLRGYLETS